MTAETRQLKSKQMPIGNDASSSPQLATKLQEQEKRNEILGDQNEYLTKAQRALQELVTEQQLTIAELREQLRNAATATPRPTKTLQPPSTAEPITIIQTSPDQFKKSENVGVVEHESDNAVNSSPKKPTPITPTKRKANARTTTARKARRKDSNSAATTMEAEPASPGGDQQAATVVPKGPVLPTSTSTIMHIQVESPSVVPSVESKLASSDTNSVTSQPTDEIRVTTVSGPTPPQKSPAETT
ncbi:hypothetical protein IWQ62_006812, partial [Dispira parvispora]